jgi:hypothetical protein
MNISSNINPYWLLLKDLSAEEKLSLIELLAKSIQGKSVIMKSQKTPSAHADWVQRFSGSWADFPETAEDMILLTEGTRTRGRDIEML